MNARTRCWSVAAALLAAAPLAAQPRPCLDVDGDRTVSFADVEAGYRVAALLVPDLDPRPDFDLRSGVTVTDLVNDFLVATGKKPAILGFEPLAAAPGETVRAVVQNLPDGVEGLRVVVSRGERSELAEAVGVEGGVLRFRMPDLGPPTEVVVVHAEWQEVATNACLLLALATGERDREGDGLPDGADTCPDRFDPQNGDTDADGLGDMCDNCPASANRDQADRNGDGSGDACEPPQSVAINGIPIAPPPGVDPRMRDIEAERPHGVLLLTREIDGAIEGRLRELGVVLQQPLARHAFVVAADPQAFAALPGLPWFHALVPLDARIRLVGDLREKPPGPNERRSVNIRFHDDISLERARELLRRLGAEILTEGIELKNDCGTVLQRVNQWQVSVSGEVLQALARLDEVLTIETVQRPTTGNATSRPAIRVDVLNTGGLNGSGITIGEWDGGWADGDNAAPPAAPGGGVNVALTGRVRVRDHTGGTEGIAYPVGCTATQITCAGLCSFGNHATHVSGTMIGDGTVAGGGAGINRGMANQAQVVSYEWATSATELTCERQDAVTSFGTRSHNNSWGWCPACNATLGFYDGLSATYDQLIRATPAPTEMFCTMNDQNYRNSLFDQCTGALDPACALPALYTAPACAAPPPGVPPPAAAPVPPANVANRFFTIEAPGGTAKSTITVGNVDTVNNRLNNSSSMGPAQDGRLKPEVVAHGTGVVSTCVPGLTDGTGTCGATTYMTMSGCSMATPAVTGAVALLYERAGQLVPPLPLQSSDVRALLAHTATDLGVHPGGAFLTMTGGQWAAFGGTDGPDFLTGYGRVNAEAARDHINSGNFGGSLQPTGCPTGVSYAAIPFASPVSVGGPGPVAGCPAMVWDVVWYVVIPPGRTQLKATLAWNDVQATAGANPAIINDIDLMVEAPGGVLYHYPWWLDPSCPYRQAARVQASVFDPSTYGDHRNTLEQVHVVGGLTAGTWRIIIRTDGLASGPQPFSLMVSVI